MNVLCTFSGKTGDILWSLPTVKWLSSMPHLGTRLDFAVMPQYSALLPLLQTQSYIRSVYVIPEWQCTGSPFGDQPWEAPYKTVPGWEQYGEVYHLTYQFHPVMSLPLHTFCSVVSKWGLDPEETRHQFSEMFPFIETNPDICDSNPVVAYAFNEMYAVQKELFIRQLRERFPGVGFVDVTQYRWLDAAQLMGGAKCFLGCRSANYVLAHGLGKRILVYEPNPARRPSTFGCPCGEEVMPEVGDFESFVRTLEGWL